MPYGQINRYDEPISIALDEYIGRNIKIGFRGYNTFGEWLAFDWFVDDVKVVPTDTTDVNVNEFANLKFNVYPNPAKDKLHVGSKSVIRQMELVAFDGRRMRQWLIDATEAEVALEGIAKGVYVLQIVTDDGVLTKKLLLE